MEKPKIVEHDKFSVAGTDSSFEIMKINDNGSMRVKWLEAGNEVELNGAQIDEYLTNGMLTKIEEKIEVAVSAAPATEASAEPKTEVSTEPQTAGRQRVKRVIRKIPNDVYVATIRKVNAMSAEEYSAMMAPTPKVK